MKPMYLILVLLSIMAALTLYILQTPVPHGATGLPHATIPAMKVGGDGMARIAPISTAVYYFQHVGSLMYACLLYIGVAEHRRDNTLKVVLGAFTLFSMIVWHQLFSAYEAFYHEGSADLVWGIPVSSLWFLIGLYGSYIPAIIFYIVAFRRYFFSEEDEAAFEALVTELKTSKGDV